MSRRSAAVPGPRVGQVDRRDCFFPVSTALDAGHVYIILSRRNKELDKPSLEVITSIRKNDLTR